MKKSTYKLFLVLLIATLLIQCKSKEKEVSAPNEDIAQQLAHHPIPEWFEREKFGIFVHYGVMGTFGHFNRQVGNQESWLTQEVFELGAKEFTINDFLVYDWAHKFRIWGARYAVLTTSQHPGFALWDSKVTDRSITQLSPYNKDLVDVWTKALRKNNLKVGLYFNHEDIR